MDRPRRAQSSHVNRIRVVSRGTHTPRRVIAINMPIAVEDIDVRSYVGIPPPLNVSGRQARGASDVPGSSSQPH